MPEVDLSEFRKPPRRRQCTVGRALDALSDEDRVKALAALADSEILGRMIHQFFITRGFSFAYSAVGVHRSGKCHCD